MQPIRSHVKLLPVSLTGEHRIGNVSPQQVTTFLPWDTRWHAPKNPLLTNKDDKLHTAPQWRIQGVGDGAIAPPLASSGKK